MERILVVDDNAELRSVVSDMLRIEGYAVSEAADGLEGLAVFASCGPDAVLLDLQMPRCGGLDALQLIRSQDLDIPVIVLTGVSDPLVECEAVRRGASGYLSKFPLDFDHILLSLRQTLDRSRRERGIQESAEITGKGFV